MTEVATRTPVIGAEKKLHIIDTDVHERADLFEDLRLHPGVPADYKQALLQDDPDRPLRVEQMRPSKDGD